MALRMIGVADAKETFKFTYDFSVNGGAVTGAISTG